MIRNLLYADDIILFGGRTIGVGGSPRLSQPQIQSTHQRWQDQGNGERWHSVPHTHSEWTTGADGYVEPICWVLDYRRWWVYDGIPYQVKQRAGDWGITAESMEKLQHTDFNKDRTNESASIACSYVRLWKLNTRKEWRNMSWRLTDERTEKNSAGFMDARNNARCTQARKSTHGLDGQHQDVDRTFCGRVNIITTEDRDKWRKYIHGVANPRIEDG